MRYNITLNVHCLSSVFYKSQNTTVYMPPEHKHILCSHNTDTPADVLVKKSKTELIPHNGHQQLCISVGVGNLDFELLSSHSASCVHTACF